MSSPSHGPKPIMKSASHTVLPVTLFWGRASWIIKSWPKAERPVEEREDEWDQSLERVGILSQSDQEDARLWEYWPGLGALPGHGVELEPMLFSSEGRVTSADRPLGFNDTVLINIISILQMRDSKQRDAHKAGVTWAWGVTWPWGL